MAPKHLLAPVDFSEASLHAARFAARLAARFKADLTLVHVAAIDEAGVAEQLAAIDTEGYPATRRVLSGEPAEAIVRAATQSGVDLIVMATHGVGMLRRFLLGSVAAKVLHDTHCRVLTTTHQSDQPELGRKPFQHVVAAVDLGPASQSVVDAAMELGPTTMLHVLPPTKLGGASYYDPARWISNAEAKLKGLASVPGVVESGAVHESINRLAEEKGVDLVVIGRHPAGIAGRLHDAAYTIIRESRVPVLSV